jgi:hypothetical protein
MAHASLHGRIYGVSRQPTRTRPSQQGTHSPVVDPAVLQQRPFAQLKNAQTKKNAGIAPAFSVFSFR